VNNEFYFANKFYEDNEDFLSVYFIGDDRAYVKDFEFSFSVSLINSNVPIFNHDFSFQNPVAVLIDRTGTVHNINIAEQDNALKSRNFYHRMNSLFSSLSIKEQ
jgi:hypothetical protein